MEQVSIICSVLVDFLWLVPAWVVVGANGMELRTVCVVFVVEAWRWDNRILVELGEDRE